MGELLYKSTRSSDIVTSAEGIIRGLADDGGLYVPIHMPKIDKEFFGVYVDGACVGYDFCRYNR